MDVTRAKDIMSSPVFTIDESATAEEAARFMTENNIKKLPVTLEEKLIGIVTNKEAR